MFFWHSFQHLEEGCCDVSTGRASSVLTSPSWPGLSRMLIKPAFSNSRNLFQEALAGLGRREHLQDNGEQCLEGGSWRAASHPPHEALAVLPSCSPARQLAQPCPPSQKGPQLRAASLEPRRRAEGAVLGMHLTSKSLFFLKCVEACREHPCWDAGGEGLRRSPHRPEAGKELGDLGCAVHGAVMLGSSRSGAMSI